MAKRMTVHELAVLPHYHPTLAEIWTYPAEALAERIPAQRVGLHPIDKARPVGQPATPRPTSACHNRKRESIMAKKSRGGRMTAAKKRAAKGPGGKGPVKNRPAGRKIMST
jgi:hypothetical protein